MQKEREEERKETPGRRETVTCKDSGSRHQKSTRCAELCRPIATSCHVQVPHRLIRRRWPFATCPPVRRRRSLQPQPA